ncbi:MAG: hypothetical protein FWC77_01650 [Defluviitaleaceae bacterium]|nr:hypothetical protein [Defluviitaleaceae bacterium]
MNYQNTFVAEISKDGNIYNARSGALVGIDSEKAQEVESVFEKEKTEMLEVIENYHSKLVELGVIVPEKSPAEIVQAAMEEQLALARQQAQQQSEINAEMLLMMKTMQDKMDTLEAAQNASNGKPETPDIPAIDNKNKKPTKAVRETA